MASVGPQGRAIVPTGELEPREDMTRTRFNPCSIVPTGELEPREDYVDMPLPMMTWNHYRSQPLGLYWQREGLKVVPTLLWASPGSYTFCFDGVPRRSTVAVSTVGVKGDESTLAAWHDGMKEAMHRLKPRRVLIYSGDVGFDFGGCEVVRYKAGGFHGRQGR